MFRPVGHQTPSVYWRRRLILVAAALALVALAAVTARVVLAKDPVKPAATGSSHPGARTTPPAASTPASHSVSRSASSSASHATSVSTPSGSASTGSQSAAPQPCVAKNLSVLAVASAASYPVGAEPTLSMQVTNTGPAPCVQNLADSQVVLRVYNGVSRVWGSHDCEIEPGTDLRTLGMNTPVKISVVWSGKSSEPDCAGTRQQVGAGTYTLYASLSGEDGKAAQFAFK
jgi:hypothetical protein